VRQPKAGGALCRALQGEEQSTVDAVNNEQKDPSACGLAAVAFVRGPELGTARNKDSAFQIVRILVVGVDTPEGVRAVQPAAYFTVFEIVEYDRVGRRAFLRRMRRPAAPCVG